MQRLRTLHRLFVAALVAASYAACGGSSTSTDDDSAGGGTNATGGTHATGGSAGRDDLCQNAEDCAWGEIEDEIRTTADCPCLLGCPYLPQSVETVERRRAQYEALCTRGQNGHGDPCPIDDCIVPPSLACVEMTCRAPR